MKQCQTCQSPHVEEIDKMILKKTEIKEIVRYLKGRYPDEVIPTYDSIKRHARLHVKELMKRAIDYNKEKDAIIRKEIKDSILAAQILRGNLEKLSKMLADTWEKIEEPKARKEIGTLIWRANQTVEILLKFADKIEGVKMTQDDILERLLYCIADFPPEYIEKLKDRWEKYGK